MFRSRIIAVALCLLALGGCAPRQSPRVEKAIPDTVADLRLPQDLTPYASKAGLNRLLLAKADQEKEYARFNRLFFSPWNSTKASVSAAAAFAVFGSKTPSKPRGWAENLLPWTAEAWTQLAENANRREYPSRLQKAVTLRPTPLREAPTSRPRFSDPAKAGQGFPFDLFMYSTLPTGMPLLVTHASKDGAWLFVESALVAGWVPEQDLAITDEAFRERYRNGRHAAIVRDNVSLRDRNGRYVSLAHVGAVLPLSGSGASGLELLAPARDEWGRAVLVPVTVNRQDASPMPLQLSPGVVARLGNEMMGQPYGWGGMFEDRDCSQMLRDLFIPFGIWLPRNSSAQAKAWDYVPFGAIDAQAKERRILAEGKPFATLLWLKGHIVLYVGEHQGKAMIFHNMWGIRTRDQGVEGRHVVGRAVITSTRPGVELPNVQDRRGLVQRMEGMSFLRAKK